MASNHAIAATIQTLFLAAKSSHCCCHLVATNAGSTERTVLPNVRVERAGRATCQAPPAPGSPQRPRRAPTSLSRTLPTRAQVAHELLVTDWAFRLCQPVHPVACILSGHADPEPAGPATRATNCDAGEENSHEPKSAAYPGENRWLIWRDPAKVRQVVRGKAGANQDSPSSGGHFPPLARLSNDRRC